MSYYYAIFTDGPLEEILEKHQGQPRAWVYTGRRGSTRIDEGDSWKDPNNIKKTALDGVLLSYYGGICK